MYLTYNAINSQYAVKQSLPLYSWGCLNFTLRYSCFSLRSKWGDLEGFYAFNAKELDEENNMYYYSARYYAPPTFISRDPLFEKYPSISPYAYCANNPVILVDPDGKAYVPTNKEGDIAINNYLKNFSSRTLKKAFAIQQEKNIYYSFDVKAKSHEEFTKALGKVGKKMTVQQKEEAYAFYCGLQDNTIYQVEAWLPEISTTETWSIKSSRTLEITTRDMSVVTQKGTVTLDEITGYAYRELNNKIFNNDFEDPFGKIDFEKIFSPNRKSTFKNINAGGEIFGEGFNYYTNYDYNGKNSRGLILIDGRKDNYGNCLGKALQTLGY